MKTVYYITTINPQLHDALDKKGKIFCIPTYLETKLFKTVQAIFHSKFNLTIIPRKAKGSVYNLNKSENPRFGRKLNTRCPDNVDAVRDSVWRSLKMSLWRHSKNLVFYVDLDKVNQFLPLSSGLTFLKWYHYFLKNSNERWLGATWIIILMGCIYFETPWCVCVRESVSQTLRLVCFHYFRFYVH